MVRQMSKVVVVGLLTLATCWQRTDGHGLMLNPVSRNALQGIDTLGGSMWFSQVRKHLLNVTFAHFDFHSTVINSIMEGLSSHYVRSACMDLSLSRSQV